MFDSLSERLRKTLGTLTGRGRISEADVDAAMREVRLALLEADVNFKVVKDFVGRVRERAVGADILASLTAGQQVVKIVNDELVTLLSAGDHTFHLSGNPAVVAMVGLQGSGKTTTTAKLARHVVKLGRRPLLVAADPYRPAAADQLETLGKQLGIPVFRAPTGTSVPEIARLGVDAAKRDVRDVVILDTAGRLSVDEALMAEIAAVNAGVRPIETLLVVDAMTGQEAVSVAQAFVAAVPVTGLILTKIDGDARGGAALSISAVTGVPVKFLGTGQTGLRHKEIYTDRPACQGAGGRDHLGDMPRSHISGRQESQPTGVRHSGDQCRGAGPAGHRCSHDGSDQVIEVKCQRISPRSPEATAAVRVWIGAGPEPRRRNARRAPFAPPR